MGICVSLGPMLSDFIQLESHNTWRALPELQVGIHLDRHDFHCYRRVPLRPANSDGVVSTNAAETQDWFILDLRSRFDVSHQVFFAQDS